MDEPGEHITQAWERLRSKDALLPCHACGGQELNVVAPGPHALSVLAPGGYIDRRKGLSVITIMCMNCGCLRLHSVPTLFDET